MIRQLEKKHEDLDILLIMNPSWGVNMPPLGLGYLDAALGSSEISCELFDINIDMYHRVSDERKTLWQFENHTYWVNRADFFSIQDVWEPHMKKYIDQLRKYAPNVLGFSVNAGNRIFTYEMIRRIRLLPEGDRYYIVVGGPLVQFSGPSKITMPEYVDVVDVVVIGEGEEAIVDIVKRYTEDESIQSSSAVMTYAEKVSRAHIVEARAPSQIAELQYPCYDGQMVQRYTEKVIPIIMTRGCCGNCRFCDAKMFQKGFRCREPEDVVAEIKQHVKQTGVRLFTFNDLAINWDLPRLEKLCDILIEEDLDILWNASATIQSHMKQSLLDKMARAGCRSEGEECVYGVAGGSLVLGLESGSDTVLQCMNKGYSAADAENMLAMCANAGIRTIVNFIVGFPGETEKEFQETLEFLTRNASHIGQLGTLSLCYLPEFSYLRQHPEEYGIIFPNDNPQYAWHDIQGNTLAVRKNRAERLMACAREVGLAPLATTLDYGEEKSVLDVVKGDVARIALVLCPPWAVETPPLGLAYLAQYLRVHDRGVDVFDMNIDMYAQCGTLHQELWQPSQLFCWTHEEHFYTHVLPVIEQHLDTMAAHVASLENPVVGFSVNRANAYCTVELAKKIRRKSPLKKLVWGGHAIAIEGERRRIPADLVDLFIFGEGECAVKELMEYCAKEKSVPVSGTLLHHGKRVSTFQASKQLDINSIPFPDFTDFNIDEYGGDTLPLLASRGCANQCAFCNDWIVWPHYRAVSAEHTFNAIQYYVKQYGVRRFEFVDLAVNNDEEQLRILCDYLEEWHENIAWIANCAIQTDMNLAIFEKMKNAGCYALRFGVESGSDMVLKKMRKPFFRKDAETVLRASADAGIENHINILVGYPGEDGAAFESTLNFIADNKGAIHRIANVHPCYLTPGSIIEREKKSAGFLCEGEDFAVSWCDTAGNTYAARKERARAVLRQAQKEGILFDEQTLLFFEKGIGDACATCSSEKNTLSRGRFVSGRRIVSVVKIFWLAFIYMVLWAIR